MGEPAHIQSSGGIKSSGGIQSAAGTIGSQGANSAQEADASGVSSGQSRKQRAIAGENARDWKERWGVTFRSEPADVLQFIYDMESGEVVVRMAPADEPDPVPAEDATLRTFLVRGLGTANLTVSAGAINNVAYAGGTITAPANGDKVYVDATISGVTVTAVTVAAAASVPANTVTHVYKLLATVAVASSIATPTPVGWNFSEMQICAGSAAWGGFGA